MSDGWVAHVNPVHPVKKKEQERENHSAINHSEKKEQERENHSVDNDSVEKKSKREKIM